MQGQFHESSVSVAQLRTNNAHHMMGTVRNLVLIYPDSGTSISGFSTGTIGSCGVMGYRKIGQLLEGCPVVPTPGIGCPIGMYYTRLTLLEGLMGGSKCTLGLIWGGGGGGGGVSKCTMGLMGGFKCTLGLIWEGLSVPWD